MNRTCCPSLPLLSCIHGTRPDPYVFTHLEGSSGLAAGSGVRGEVRECVSPSLRLARFFSRSSTARGDRPPTSISAAAVGLPQPDMAFLWFLSFVGAAKMSTVISQRAAWWEVWLARSAYRGHVKRDDHTFRRCLLCSKDQRARAVAVAALPVHRCHVQNKKRWGLRV